MKNGFNINICVVDKAALLLLDSVSSLAATVLTDSDILREILLTGGKPLQNLPIRHGKCNEKLSGAIKKPNGSLFLTFWGSWKDKPFLKCKIKLKE